MLHDTAYNKEPNQELKDIFTSAGKMKTSPDFTQNIMRLLKEESANQIVYKPLISTSGWIGIAIFILMIFFITLTYGTNSSSQTLEAVQQINHIFSFKIPVNALITTSSKIGEYLLSSKVFLSLIGLLGLGVIYSFFFFRIEMLRKNQIFHS